MSQDKTFGEVQIEDLIDAEEREFRGFGDNMPYKLLDYHEGGAVSPLHLDISDARGTGTEVRVLVWSANIGSNFDISCRLNDNSSPTYNYIQDDGDGTISSLSANSWKLATSISRDAFFDFSVRPWDSGGNVTAGKIDMRTAFLHDLQPKLMRGATSDAGISADATEVTLYCSGGNAFEAAVALEGPVGYGMVF